MDWKDILLLIIGGVGAVISWLFNRTITAHDENMKELKEAHKDLEEKREKDLVHIFGKLSEAVDSQRLLTKEIHNLHTTLLENYVRRDDLTETTRRFELAVNNLAKELTERISELKEDIREDRRTRQ
jgi:uncharacterized membrane-anchored protein YhcB (DUF1043 family)